MELAGLLFKAEDFELCKDELSQERMTQRAAHLANLRLKEWLEKAPEVYRHVKHMDRIGLTLPGL